MLPLGIFRIRQFSAVNVVTFCVYAALGSVFFFVVAATCRSSPASRRSRAGVALLPVTVLMLLLSARAGALAQRIGPRLPMTSARCSPPSGCCMLSRIGAGADYWTDVLPAVTSCSGSA